MKSRKEMSRGEVFSAVAGLVKNYRNPPAADTIKAWVESIWAASVQGIDLSAACSAVPKKHEHVSLAAIFAEISAAKTERLRREVYHVFDDPITPARSASRDARYSRRDAIAREVAIEVIRSGAGKDISDAEFEVLVARRVAAELGELALQERQ